MHIRTVLKTSLPCLFLILSANLVVTACSCRTPGPVLDQVERSDIIIIGHIIGFNGNRASVEVDRVYKGGLTIGAQLDFVNGGSGDCSRGYKATDFGQKYLFYLKSPNENSMFSPSICGRSNLIQRAFDDLAYLDNLPNVVGRTRLSGNLISRDSIVPKLDKLSIGIRKIDGKKEHSLKTDRNGFFEIYDLPPGDYVIEVQPPLGWRIDTKHMFGTEGSPSSQTRSYAITVEAKRHTLTRIMIVEDDQVQRVPKTKS